MHRYYRFWILYVVLGGVVMLELSTPVPTSYPCSQTWLTLADCLTQSGLSLKQTNALASSLSAQSFHGFFPSLELLSRLCKVGNPRQPLRCLGMILSTTKCRRMGHFIRYVDLEGLAEAMRSICPTIDLVLAKSQSCLPKARSDLRVCVGETYPRAKLPERAPLRPSEAIVCKNYLSIFLCIQTAYSECPDETRQILLTQVRYTQPNFCKLIYWDSATILDTCSVTLEAIGRCLQVMNATLTDGLNKNAYNPVGIKRYLDSEVCPDLFVRTNSCLNRTIHGSPCQWVKHHSDQYYHDVEHLNLHLCSKESVECASSRAAFSRCYHESGVIVDPSSWSMNIAGLGLVLNNENICASNYDHIKSCLTGASSLSRCRQSRDLAKLSVLEGAAEALKYFCEQDPKLKSDAIFCLRRQLPDVEKCTTDYRSYLAARYGTRTILVEMCQAYMEGKFCMNQVISRTCATDQRRLLWTAVDRQQPEQCNILDLVMEDSPTMTTFPVPRKECLAVVEWYAFCQGLGGARTLRHDTLLNMADPVAMATYEIIESVSMETCDESHQLTETLPCLRRTVDTPEPYCIPLDNMNFSSLEKTGRILCQNFELLKTEKSCLQTNQPHYLSCYKKQNKLCSSIASARNCIAASYHSCSTTVVETLQQIVAATGANLTDTDCSQPIYTKGQSGEETSLAELVGRLGLVWDVIANYFSPELASSGY